MVRHRNKSDVILQAQRRLAGMKSISLKLDLGSGCSTGTVETKLNEVRENLERHNALVSKAAAASTEFDQAEKELAALSSKIFLGAALKYSKDSKEYEMVGGTRTNERRKARRKPVVQMG